jgi:phenylacetate-CoA ligase
LIRSQIPGCAWPAIPDDRGAQALALQYQLEHTQWLPPAQIRSAQLGQLHEVLVEAFRKIAWWRETLGRAGFVPGERFGEQQFARLPILLREEVQTLAERLFNPEVPASHGEVGMGSTSGSTGTPVRFRLTSVTQHFWRALMLREHLWQGRDFSGKLAAIRSNVESGELPGWGPTTDQVVATGPLFTLNIRADIDAQLDWLVARAPHYVITHPSNLRALAGRAIERGIALPALRQLRTFGEVLSEETRRQCRRAWNVGIADIYSCEEAGIIALQCEQGSYHVQSENLLVEIVDERGAACAPGEIGRVLITTLHNLAMPLVRYEIGDYARWAPDCPCGRGLPVIAQIMGRRRNMLRLPDGTQHWPSFPESVWVDIAPIRQLQVVQKALDAIVLRVRAERALTAEEASRLIDTFRSILCFPHRITIEPVSSIARSPNLKYEDFVSELHVS